MEEEEEDEKAKLFYVELGMLSVVRPGAELIRQTSRQGTIGEFTQAIAGACLTSQSRNVDISQTIR
jgi:hypothetical protein